MILKTVLDGFPLLIIMVYALRIFKWLVLQDRNSDLANTCGLIACKQ
jgi:hypothetical protein